MFDLSRNWRAKDNIVATESQQQSAEQQQRDIYETHRHRVFSVSYYMTSNEVEAEQMLTETFVEAFAQSPAPDARRVDQALLQQLEARFALTPEASAIPDTNLPLERGQARRTDLEEAVALLPAQERLVFLLRDVEGYAPARIAELLQCEEFRVHEILVSARIRTRNELARLKLRPVPPPQDPASGDGEDAPPYQTAQGDADQQGMGQ